jgi:hypothetical protein
VSDETGSVEELADKTAQIVVAGANETWPYRKLMLAVLPPTLALLIAVIGLWESSNRDRAAAAEAEKQREQEVADDQSAFQRDQRLREAELVLPRYEDLLERVHATSSSVDRCRGVLTTFAESVTELELRSDGALVASGPLPPPSGPIAPENLEIFTVPEEVVTACSEIQPTIGPLELSLDMALLVSNQDLAASAEDLAVQLQHVSTRAETVLGKIDEQTGEVLIDRTGTYFADGTSTANLLVELSDALAEIEPASERLVDTVRGVVLLSD